MKSLIKKQDELIQKLEYKLHLSSDFEISVKHHKVLYFVTFIVFVLTILTLVFGITKFGELATWAEIVFLIISSISIGLTFLSVFVWRFAIFFRYRSLFTGLVINSKEVCDAKQCTKDNKGYFFRLKFKYFFFLKSEIVSNLEHDIKITSLEIDIPNNSLNMWYEGTVHGKKILEYMKINLHDNSVEFFDKKTK